MSPPPNKGLLIKKSFKKVVQIYTNRELFKKKKRN